MIRHVAATAFVLTLTPALLYAQRAQDPVFTVTAQSADVHKGPSTVTPVIGHVARGAALPVGRNLGSWVRIAWPSAPDGVGYLHVTTGRLSGVGTEPSAAPSRSTSVSTRMPAPAPTAVAMSPASPTSPSGRTSPERVGVQGPQGVTTISHVVGVGGLVQSAKGFGATGRAWRNERVGLELRFTRNAMTSDTAAGRMTSLEFEPRVAFALFDHVSDYVWVRPYVGSGVSFGHHTLNVTLPEGGPEAAQTASSNNVALRLFGGSELTFAGATRFGLSAEAGYRPSSTPFTGFETDRFTLSIAGHWYIK